MTETTARRAPPRDASAFYACERCGAVAQDNPTRGDVRRYCAGLANRGACACVAHAETGERCGCARPHGGAPRRSASAGARSGAPATQNAAERETTRQRRERATSERRSDARRRRGLVARARRETIGAETATDPHVATGGRLSVAGRVIADSGDPETGDACDHDWIATYAETGGRNTLALVAHTCDHCGARRTVRPTP